ncbi:MAG TPA: protocatechuate 3,4-dioxygenase subunit alpha [Ktedonobacterales bacterium]
MDQDEQDERDEQNGLEPTASQTVGPFFRIGLEPLFLPEVAGLAIPGEHVTIRGRVLDGDGQPVPDAVIETWQADADGHYADPASAPTPGVGAGFSGFGRTPTDAEGRFTLTTITPGRVTGPGGALQAPHLVALVFMRGLLRHLVTRVYFPAGPGLEDDPILRLVPTERRATLIARPVAGEPGVFAWDIHLQGADETVFFDA